MFRSFSKIILALGLFSKTREGTVRAGESSLATGPLVRGQSLQVRKARVRLFSIARWNCLTDLSHVCVRSKTERSEEATVDKCSSPRIQQWLSSTSSFTAYSFWTMQVTVNLVLLTLPSAIGVQACFSVGYADFEAAKPELSLHNTYLLTQHPRTH